CGVKMGLCLPLSTVAICVARRPRVRPSASTTSQLRWTSAGRAVYVFINDLQVNMDELSRFAGRDSQSRARRGSAYLQETPDASTVRKIVSSNAGAPSVNPHQTARGLEGAHPHADEVHAAHP